MDAGSVHCCVTSPPYWGLRDYGVDGQIGLESSFDGWLAEMVAVFACVKRVLRDDGTLWVNIGDAYAQAEIRHRNGTSENFDRPSCRESNQTGRKVSSGLAPKNLIGMPWRLAFALQADGWYLRSDIIWHKPNPMPESVRDRPTKAHEYIFLLSKSERYFYDADAIAEPVTDEEYRTEGKIRPTADGGKGFEIRGGLHNQAGGRATKNARTVWTIPTEGFAGAHYATFPRELAGRCIKAGCPAGGLVLDPFGGTGTTAEVALKLARRAVIVELNPEYVAMARKRLTDRVPLFSGEVA